MEAYQEHPFADPAAVTVSMNVVAESDSAWQRVQPLRRRADVSSMPRRVWRNYNEYLQPWDWLRLQNREFARTDYRCEQCEFHGTDKQLEVHHLHYQTLGREQTGDVRVLCSGAIA